MSLTPRSEALPLHKLYACVSSNSFSDSSETTSQYGSIKNHKNKAYALTSETPEPFPKDYNKRVTIH